MPRKPGPMNPDSTAGNARLGTGRGPNAGRSQPLPKGSVPKAKKFKPPAGGSFSADSREINRLLGKVTQRELDLDNGYFRFPPIKPRKVRY